MLVPGGQGRHPSKGSDLVVATQTVTRGSHVWGLWTGLLSIAYR